MEIYKKEKEETTAGMLGFGDTFESVTGKIFMVVGCGHYIDEGYRYGVMIVDLKEGIMDCISRDARIRPIKLVAREE